MTLSFFIGYVEDNNNDMYLVDSCCESRTKQHNYPLYMGSKANKA